jgi:hypothetical protein
VPDSTQMRFGWILYDGLTGGFEIWRAHDRGLAMFWGLSPEFQHRVLAGF